MHGVHVDRVRFPAARPRKETKTASPPTGVFVFIEKAIEDMDKFGFL